MKNGKNQPSTCDWARERIHLRLDGERLASGELALLERHITCCADCATAANELEQLQSSLRGLSQIPLPDAALERVWSRTSRRRGWLSAGSWSLPQWSLAAAAATLALALIGVWQLALPTPVTPTADAGREAVVGPPVEQDVERAVAELKMVFGVTAQALHRTETTLDEVLVERISPALQKTRLPWFHRAKDKNDV